MPTVTINSYAYSDITAAFAGSVSTPADGTYYALDEFGSPPSEQDPVYEDLKITFPGVDGVGRKRFGFRGRQINVDLVVIAAKASVWSNVASLLAGFKQLARFTITWTGGPTRQGCVLADCGRPVQRTVGTKCCVTLPLTFEQLSETN